MRLLIISLGLLLSSLASAGALVEGKDYKTLVPAQPTPDPTKIVVTEFFSYGCPHCYELSAELTEWTATLPADVLFVRVPVSFGRPNWASIGQAYLALQAMGKLDQHLDQAIFSAIHVQRLSLGDVSSIAGWLSKQGINGKEFVDVYNSFGVQSNQRRAEQDAIDYGVDSVPTLFVDGKYRVMGESHAALLANTSALIEKVRATRPAPAVTVPAQPTKKTLKPAVKPTATSDIKQAEPKAASSHH